MQCIITFTQTWYLQKQLAKRLQCRRSYLLGVGVGGGGWGGGSPTKASVPIYPKFVFSSDVTYFTRKPCHKYWFLKKYK